MTPNITTQRNWRMAKQRCNRLVVGPIFGPMADNKSNQPWWHASAVSAYASLHSLALQINKNIKITKSLL